MRLSEYILTGIQNWYRTTAKDLCRARRRTLVAFGRQLELQDCPESLSEAKDLLRNLLARLQAVSESGAQLPFVAPLRRKAQVLQHAIVVAESRDGEDVPSLVNDMLADKASLADAIDRNSGYSLAHCLPSLVGFCVYLALFMYRSAGAAVAKQYFFRLQV